MFERLAELSLDTLRVFEAAARLRGARAAGAASSWVSGSRGRSSAFTGVESFMWGSCDAITGIYLVIAERVLRHFKQITAQSTTRARSLR